MALVITAGSTSANSYADATYADTYFQTHLMRDRWTVIRDAAMSEAALLAAMPIIEEQDYLGVKKTTTQALNFPRVGEYMPRSWTSPDAASGTDWTDHRGRVWDGESVPSPISDAQCELALIMAENDSWFEHKYASKQITTGSAEVAALVGRDLQELPHSVYRLIAPFVKTTHAGGRLVRS